MNNELDQEIDKMNRMLDRVRNRHREFVEEKVRPAVKRLFPERGIPVYQISGAIAERNGDAMEVDLLVVNDTDAIVIEVKSELKLDDVKDHLNRLARFKKLFPHYQEFRIMGAVAAMVIPDTTARYAYRQGLFVLGQNGDTVIIRNDAAFKPATW